jgi:RHS repeat-associated protein
METDATFTYLLLKNWGQSRPSPRFRPANYVYDAENRLIAAGGMSYVYDGDGKRVKKCTEGSTAGICATGATGTLYWGVPGSETLAETDLAGNVLENYIYFNGQRIARREPTSPPTIHFYFSDHLGTHSLITDLNGTMPPQEESDYFPYGGEIPISGGDPNHYKFTGKERDSESGLDNFGARFFTSNIGRFMTPDWAARPTTVPYAVFGDPQSLNLYGYVRNDPVSSADADGHGCFEGNRDNPGNCSGDLMNAFVNDLAGLGAATHDTYDDTDTWSMLEEMATPSAQNTTQQQVNRQPDGSYKATPAQLAEIRAADKNGTIITNQSDPLGQCVTACERFTGVPGPTSSWRKGKAATDLTDKDIGTAIATFQGSGVAARYKSDAGGHKNSGIFMGTSVGGFWMADQCRGKSL